MIQVADDDRLLATGTLRRFVSYPTSAAWSSSVLPRFSHSTQLPVWRSTLSSWFTRPYARASEAKLRENLRDFDRLPDLGWCGISIDEAGEFVFSCWAKGGQREQVAISAWQTGHEQGVRLALEEQEQSTAVR